MINRNDTMALLDNFFNDCLVFWKREGKSQNEAFDLALKDVSHVIYNPFEPNGDLLDVGGKEEYIKKMINDNIINMTIQN